MIRPMNRVLRRLAGLAIRNARQAPDEPARPDEQKAAEDAINFNVASGKALLGAPHRQAMMLRIYDLCGIGRDHFDAVYVPCTEEFAAYVQSLPASERHHHARVEGLLDHALDTAASALTLRQAYLLPPDSEPETVRRRGDLWTFGVFLAALFHDVGKAATDHEVELLDNGGRPIGEWSALAGPMPAPYYRARFRSERRYTDHLRLGAVVMRPLLPKPALDWLFSDTELTVQLIEFLSGEKAGVLAQIVREADMNSVQADLDENPNPTVNADKSVSRRILDAFRELLDNGRLPINKPGAAAWVTEMDVWLVSKRALDTARDHIRTVSGHVIPKSNQACMDELQAAKICVATDAGKAVWRMEVCDEKWSKSLSFLRIPIDTMWPLTGDRPSMFSGDIAEPNANPSEKHDKVEAAAPQSEPLEEEALTDPIGSPSSEQPEEADGAVTPAENASDENAQPTIEIPEPGGFYMWVKNGIASGKLTLNVKNAPLHVVHEGLFMVSPRVFKWYTDNNNRWKRVQRKVIKDGYVLKSMAGTNIIEYSVQGDRRASSISGMVIREPESVLGIVLPPENPLFARVTPCQGID